MKNLVTVVPHKWCQVGTCLKVGEKAWCVVEIERIANDTDMLTLAPSDWPLGCCAELPGESYVGLDCPKS